MKAQLAAMSALIAMLAASPAAAEWGSTHWGMTLSEVVALPGLAAAQVKDEKGRRVLHAHRLAIGKSEIDGISYEVEFLFEAKAKTLSKVNLVPAKEDCERALSAFMARMGDGKVERKSQNLLPDRPPLVSEEHVWPDPQGKGTISFNGVKFGDEPEYCQILYEA
jgi:hypothetical protein